MVDVEETRMKFRVVIAFILVTLVSVSNSAKITRFHSVGKNYNINYNSNTNTNFDFSQLYNNILSQLFDSQVQVPNPCHGGYCSGLYDHFTASFSLDADEDELDEADDEVNPPVGKFSKETALIVPINVSERIDNETTANPISDDDKKLEILQMEAVEVPSVSNQTEP